jgi:hypothetical protein
VAGGRQPISCFRIARDSGGNRERDEDFRELCAILGGNYGWLPPTFVDALNPSHSSGVNVSRRTISNRPL